MHNDLQDYKDRARAALRTTNPVNRTNYNRPNLIEYARYLDRRGIPHDIWDALRRISR